MGMHTEIMVKGDVFLKQKDQNTEAALRYFFTGQDLPEDFQAPRHELFRCLRWEGIGRCASDCHHPKVIRSFEHSSVSTTTSVFMRCDLKAYDDEHVHFFDWVAPYVDAIKDDVIGYHWYEDDEAPTLIRKVTD